MSFPTIVYKSPGAHPGPPVGGKSTTYESKGIASEAALQAALAAGWFRTLPEAIDPSKRAPVGATFDEPAAGHVLVQPAAPAASIALTPAAVSKALAESEASPSPTRAELDEKAKALGIKLDKRTSDEDLAKRIAGTLARAPHLATRD